MINFYYSMLLFWICYFIVTIIGILHTIFNIAVLKMGSMKDGPGMGEGYEKTKPWHPLYNIILFPIFGYLYMSSLTGPTFMDALIMGIIWVVICIIVDLIGWVLIKHPWSLTFREFYVDYQPWISLVYIAIFLGPIIGYYVLIL